MRRQNSSHGPPSSVSLYVLAREWSRGWQETLSSFVCFRKFRPFHLQFKSFPEISFLGPKAASPFEAPMTPSSSHHTRWVFLVPEYKGWFQVKVLPAGALLVSLGNGHVLAP